MNIAMEILEKNIKAISKKLVDEDLDYLLVIIGYERSGKSTLALQIAQMVDPDFSVENICFDIPSLYAAMYESKKGGCIIVDEGATSFFSREAMKEETREGVKLLTVCGERNVFLIICVPDFGLLDKYARQHRAQSVIRITKRGYFSLYSPRASKKIRFDAKTKKWVYPQASLSGAYTKLKGKLWEAYKEKKTSYLIDRKDNYKSEWVSLGQACNLASRTRNTVWTWGKKGLVGVMNHKGQAKYNYSDIQKLLAKPLGTRRKQVTDDTNAVRVNQKKPFRMKKYEK